MDNFGSTTNVVAYDPAANAWSTLLSLPATRQGAVVQRMGNRIVVAMGAIQTNQPQSAAWVGLLG